MENALQSTLLSFLGELGYGIAGIHFVIGKEGRGVIRVTHASVDHVKTGLMMLQRVGEHPAAARSLGVSGMLAKAQRLIEL